MEGGNRASTGSRLFEFFGAQGTLNCSRLDGLCQMYEIHCIDIETAIVLSCAQSCWQRDIRLPSSIGKEKTLSFKRRKRKRPMLSVKAYIILSSPSPHIISPPPKSRKWERHKSDNKARNTTLKSRLCRPFSFMIRKNKTRVQLLLGGGILAGGRESEKLSGGLALSKEQLDYFAL